MRNIWTLLQREYLERVRTRSFVIFTLVMPAFMAGSVLVPTKLAEMNPVGCAPGAGGQQSPDRNGGHARVDMLKTTQRSTPDENPLLPTTYVIQVDTTPTETERDLLRSR